MAVSNNALRGRLNATGLDARRPQMTMIEDKARPTEQSFGLGGASNQWAENGLNRDVAWMQHDRLQPEAWQTQVAPGRNLRDGAGWYVDFGDKNFDEVQADVNRTGEIAPYLRYGNPSGRTGTGDPSTVANASTGGTGMNENTDVSNIAADIMRRDSPLMRLAATRGRQEANKRGMMNSSMGANAVYDAVLDQVVPMASQESAQRFQSNRAIQDYDISSRLSDQDFREDSALSAQGYQQNLGLASQAYGFQRGLNEQNYGFERGLNEQNYGFERGLADQAYNIERGLNEQNYGFDVGRINAQGDVESRLNEENYGYDTGRMRLENELSITRDNNAFENERELEGMRIDAGRDEAALDREFEREMTGIEWDGRFGLAELDGQIRMDLMDRESEMRTRITRLENELEAKNVSMDAFFTARQQYNSRIDQIMANPDLSAEERGKQIDTAMTHLETNIQGIEDMYNINLPWTDYEPAPAPVDASQVRSDIENIYREVLGRDADMAGANAYEEAVLSGAMTLDQVRAEIRNSLEGNGSIQAVQSDLDRLYWDILGRGPDAPGMNFWTDQVLSGNVTLADVEAAFREEAQSGGQAVTPSDDSNLSTQDKVNALRAAYTNILGRDNPDAEGFNFWRDALINGRTTVAEMQAAFRAEAANQ